MQASLNGPLALDITTTLDKARDRAVGHPRRPADSSSPLHSASIENAGHSHPWHRTRPFDLELLDTMSTCAYDRVVPASPCLQSPTQEQARIEALIERLAADKALFGQLVLAVLISLFTSPVK